MTNRTRSALVLILAGFAVLAVAYAVATPPWQNPDEPAHYNYARNVADDGALPVLHVGDYDQAELERLKASKFAGNPDISAIRYESYQPPLYYLAGGGLIALVPGTAQDLLALRLLSVLLGTCVLATVFSVARAVFPDDTGLALAATGIVAFIPQHVAVSAAANNDALGTLVLSLIVLLGIHRLRGCPERTFVVVGALLMGIGLLSKVTTYAGAVILLAAEVGRWRLSGGGPLRRHLFVVAAVAAGALMLAGWWFVRNALTYGPLDILGLARHDQVVVGQPRTILGLEAARHLVVFTFQSFWAVFGWMGVLVDARIYGLLALLTITVLVGLVLYLIGPFRQLATVQRWALGLLALELALMVGLLLTYNLTYVQAQGRYLLPAAAAIGMVFALGLREMVCRPRALAGLWLVAGLMLFIAGSGGLFLAIVTAAAVAVALVPLVARGRSPAVIWSALILSLAVLTVICLLFFIIPGLSY